MDSIKWDRVCLPRTTRVRREGFEHVKITRTRMDRKLEEAIMHKGQEKGIHGENSRKRSDRKIGERAKEKETC